MAPPSPPGLFTLRSLRKELSRWKTSKSASQMRVHNKNKYLSAWRIFFFYANWTENYCIQIFHFVSKPTWVQKLLIESSCVHFATVQKCLPLRCVLSRKRANSSLFPGWNLFIALEAHASRHNRGPIEGLLKPLGTIVSWCLMGFSEGPELGPERRLASRVHARLVFVEITGKSR